MQIHHFTLPALEPERVARVLGELTGGKVVPMPHPSGAWMIADRDQPSTLLEVWPAGARADVGSSHIVFEDDPGPARWPHQAYLSVDLEVDAIRTILDREGWSYDVAHNGPPGGPGFELVRAWIENRTVLELASPTQLAQYQGFCRAFFNRP